MLRLLEELGKLHRGAIPPNLVQQIKACGGYFGSAAAATLTLFEFRDQDALEELRQHPDLRRCLTPFSAGNRALASVPADKLTETKEILACLGVVTREGL